MSKSSQAYVADMERRVMSGEFDRVIDPYDHDIVMQALRRIAGGHDKPWTVARVALDRIEDRAARKEDP